MAGVADKVFALVKDAVEAQGVKLWDVRFLKEGAAYYLRIFIDSENGISIDDCTNVSHAIDDIIDEADPIDSSYYLEVCSAGLGRELVRDEHFLEMIGQDVKIRLLKAFEGTKEYIGVLSGYSDGTVVIKCGESELRFTRKDIAKATLEDF